VNKNCLVNNVYYFEAVLFYLQNFILQYKVYRENILYQKNYF